jgi:serine/threonine-protein kinase
LERKPAISSTVPTPTLGIAHGWSGNLYALMRWCRSGGLALPEMIVERLDELRGMAIDKGRGLCWRWYGRADTDSVAGWCNGSAGFIHLWTLAHDLCGDPWFAELAEAAGWNAWETDEGDGNLCCGLAGRAYALLELHRFTGEKSWLDRAQRLAAKAVAGQRDPTATLSVGSPLGSTSGT